MPHVYKGLRKHKRKAGCFFSTAHFCTLSGCQCETVGWCSKGGFPHSMCDDARRVYFSTVWANMLFPWVGKFVWRSERLPVFSIWSLDVWLHKCARREAWCWQRFAKNLCSMTLLWKEGILTWKLLQSVARKERRKKAINKVRWPSVSGIKTWWRTARWRRVKWIWPQSGV